MLNFSEDFANGTAKITKIWLDFTLANGTIFECNEDRVSFNGFTRDTSTTAGNEFTVGAAVTGEITCSLNNYDNAFSGYDFRDAVVVAWLGGRVLSHTIDDVYLEDDVIASNIITLSSDITPEQVASLFELDGLIAFGTNKGEQDIAVTKISNILIDQSTTSLEVEDTISVPASAYISVLAEEKVNVGRYYVDEYTYNGTNINIVAYDDMCKFDVQCKNSNVSWASAKTIADLINSALSVAGITLWNNTLPGPSGYSVEQKPEQWDTMTWHDVIAYCAQIMCCYAHIVYVPNPGAYQLKFEWYNTAQLTSNQYDGGTFDTDTTPYSDGAELDGGDFEYDDYSEVSTYIRVYNTDIAPGNGTGGGKTQSEPFIEFEEDRSRYDLVYEITGDVVNSNLDYSANISDDGTRITLLITNNTESTQTQETGNVYITIRYRIMPDSADGGTFGDRSDVHIVSSPYSLTVDTDDVQITGVTVSLKSTDNINADSGTQTIEVSSTNTVDGYIIQITDNPFIETLTQAQTVANYLEDYIVGMRFRPLSASCLENPLMEAGDIAIITGRNGNTYSCFLSRVTYTVNSSTQISCDAVSSMQNLKARYSEAQKTQAMVQRVWERSLSDAETAMSGILGALATTMGLYNISETQTDGSVIYMFGDASTKAASTKIWRFSAGSLTVSNDGGTTWNAALSAEGILVLQELYAIKINAENIITGLLTLGGTNNTNGTMRVLNSNGVQIGKWDKDGIEAINLTAYGSLICYENYTIS